MALNALNQLVSLNTTILIPNMTYLHGKNLWVIFEVTGDLQGHLEVRCGQQEDLKCPKSVSLIEHIILIPNMIYLHGKHLLVIFEVTNDLRIHFEVM